MQIRIFHVRLPRWGQDVDSVCGFVWERGREEDEKPTAVTAGSEVNEATGEGGDPL
jgi:hypothetical protein